MASIFSVKFSDDETLVIDDIIDFQTDQKTELVRIASEYTRTRLRNVEEEGKDLSYLTNQQKLTVVKKKNCFVRGKTADELRKEKKILIAIHSNIRILERLGSDELSVVISLIDRIINTDKVVKAQFKGHPTLSYTMAKSNDPNHYRLPISFEKTEAGGRIIKMISVSFRGALPKKMTTSIHQDDKMAEKMLSFKKKLMDQSRKKNGGTK